MMKIKKSENESSVRRSHLHLFFLLGLLLLFSFGQAGAMEEDRIQITTRKGDSLIKICRELLAEPQKWPEIAKINKIRNPHVIPIGTELQIPVKLLKEEPLAGEAVFVKGDVRMQMADGAEWIPLRKGDAVRQKSRIKTGEKSRVQIRYTDGSALLLTADSEMLITASAEKKNYGIVRDLMMRAGRVIADMKKSRVFIRTETAVAGIRGTRFRVSIDAEQASRSEVLEGIVDVEAGGKEVVVNGGEGTLVQKGTAPMEPVKLLSPPKFSDVPDVYEENPVRFGIEGTEGAVSYHAELAKGADMMDTLSEKILAPGESFNVGDIPSGTYYLRVSGIDRYGLEGMPSQPLAVNIRTKEPVAPLSISEKTLLFLADTSGSMQEKISYTKESEDRRESGMTLVKEILSGIYGQLPAQCSSGIRLLRYLPGNKELYEEFLPADRHEKDQVLSEIKENFITDYPLFNRRTPLARALRQLEEKEFKDTEVPLTLVLISDGEENMDDDDSPLKEVERLREKYGEKLILHTVFAGEKDEGKERLQQMAEKGGGTFFSATEMMENMNLFSDFSAMVCKEIQE
ncbi:MAG: FecR domain-containing protein [Desulfococcaceae bacterium]|jgi:hypothetical protein|nr:FecR domain-containing protein [Desulfococcaceae bacterium]